ncbi:hypothetical protein AAG570_010797 [Ranatra chinensis]|uniref:Reverse transcriptase domain-containing protein n=1 Tax=Ranatra chinensis TaxID=642074 RepID=A0ABD0YNJ2_9HEMI
MDWASNEYDAILGTDALRCVKGSVRMRKYDWIVRLRTMRYRSEGGVSRSRYVGAAVVKKMDHIRANNVTQHFEAVFYTEGEPLSATGRVRRYPQALMDVIRQELKNLLDQGIIRKSISPYCSALWVVPKPPDAQGNLHHRVLEDYKELNKHTRSEKYPVPRLEDMLDRMNGASVFSILDLKAGHHQIRMHEADCEKTAFQFERGNYEFTRMPFGLKNAPATFQRLMDEFLEGLDEGAIQVYMDDIIVFSRSEQEHDEHLVQLLRRLKEFGLKVSREKTMFFQPSVKCLGYVVSEREIHPDPGKVEAIKNRQVLVDVKGVRSLMGLINFYRRFLPCLAVRMERWNHLTKKRVKFEITDDMLKSLDWAKEHLCRDPVLRFPDFTKQFVVTTDASQVALGAVISQLDHLGDRPVAFANIGGNSRPQSRDTAPLKENCSVSYGRWSISGPTSRETSARVARWKESLAAYSFTISHNKGKDNVVADCLSRMVNALDATTPSSGPSRRRLRINGSKDSPDVVDLPLLEHPEGESSIIPMLDLLRRRVVEEPGLPTVQVPDSREIPSRSPEPDRRNVEWRAMTWLSDTLDDKARQLVVRIVSGDTVRSTFRKIGQNRVWKLEIGSQAQNRDVCRITDELVEPGQTYYVYGDTTDGQKLITVLYETGLLAKGSVLTRVTKRLTIIEGEE